MKIIADTNVLLRAVVQDDPQQSKAAAQELEAAEVIAIPLTCLCEFAWVLRSVYRYSQQELLAALEALVQTDKVAVDRPAVDAGLEVLRNGGDFADGAIAYEGRWLGGEVFVSFDSKAVELIERRGERAKLLR